MFCSIILPGLEGPHNLSYSFQLNHIRVGFKHRWVNQSGGCYTTQPNGSSIAVDATTAVSDEALSKVSHFSLLLDYIGINSNICLCHA